MVDDLGTDLDQFLPQRGQRPVLDLLRQCKRPHEVAQIVSPGMKLEANLVVCCVLRGAVGCHAAHLSLSKEASN